MGIKVAKFGGTSLANAAQFAKVIDIVRNDADRRYVVPSAPGKRGPEDEKITDVDFVELSACAGGCVGGILTVENPFLARTRLQKIQGHLSPEAQPPEVTDERLMLFDHPIKFCEVLSLARDLTTAMELLARVDEIEQDLYGMDCGACGAPSCRALATDIALGRAAVEDCIYIQRDRHTAKP